MCLKSLDMGWATDLIILLSINCSHFETRREYLSMIHVRTTGWADA